MKISLYYQTILGALLLFFLQWIISIIMGDSLGVEKMIWLFLSDLMVVFLLRLLVLYNTCNSYRLMAITFIVFFGIGSFNILIEAYIFNVTNRMETLKQIIVNVFEMAAFSFFFVKFILKDPNPKTITFETRKFGAWLWKIFLGDILYLFIYLLAGMILYLSMPGLNEFYGDKIPPMDLIIKTQLFLRAFIFIAIAFLINRTTVLPKYQGAVLIGFIFSIIGGIAPLMIPNDLMPQFVRIGHGFEVGISNFVYGFLLSVLLYQKRESDVVNKIAYSKGLIPTK